jgi:ferredoxin
VQVCPEVFEIRADGFLYLFMEEVPAELQAKAKEAEDLCPTGAITLVGDDGKPLR